MVSVGVTSYLSEAQIGSYVVGLRHPSKPESGRRMSCYLWLMCICARPMTDDVRRFFSLRRRVISVPAADLQSFVICHNFDGPVSSIVHEICRMVRERILTAQVVLNLGKGVGYILRLKWPECASTGCI